MSVIEEAVRWKLVNVAGVSALVSTRVYSSELPQKPTYPAVIYERVDSQRDYTLSGPSGFVTSTFQLRAYAETYGGAKTLAVKIRQSINGMEGTILGVRLLGVFLQSESDEFDDELQNNSVLLDYTINHDEVL